MTAGLLITFREGLEAFLVVGIILTYLGRCNLNKYSKWVFVGAGIGLLSAILLGLLFQIYYSGFESSLGELYLKVTIMGFAIIVLTYMVIWMARNGRNMKGEIEKNLEHVISTGSVLALVMMSFLAILREGFETVLFLGALYGNEMSTPVYYGGIIGLIMALIVTVAIFKGIRNLPIKQFFNITGGLIMLIAAGLLSNMVGILQDINIIPVLKQSVFDLSWLMVDSSEIGIFFKALFGYTHSPSLAQVASYTVYFIIILLLYSRWGKGKIIHKEAVARA